MKKIFQAANRIEAEIIRGKLEVHGIDALVKCDDEGGTNLGLQLTLGCFVYVRDEDEERALEIIHQPQSYIP